jgi:hypothetical protein
MAALAEEEFIEKLAGRVASRVGAVPATKKDIGNRYVREKEAATFLGISVFSLRSWRSRGSGGGPSWTRVGGMVMYSVKELEKYMKKRSVVRR